MNEWVNEVAFTQRMSDILGISHQGKKEIFRKSMLQRCFVICNSENFLKTKTSINKCLVVYSLSTLHAVI